MAPEEYELSVKEAIPDGAVAAYYCDFPAQLAVDHPHLDPDRARARIAYFAGKEEWEPTPGRNVGTTEIARRLLQLEQTNSLPVEAQQDAAACEAERRRRARKLGLPEDPGPGWASEDQVRRASLRLVTGEEADD